MPVTTIRQSLDIWRPMQLPLPFFIFQLRFYDLFLGLSCFPCARPAPVILCLGWRYYNPGWGEGADVPC